MELGSDYLAESGGGSGSGSGSGAGLSSTEPSLNGLKFGKKIYFEDGGTSGAPFRGSGSSSGSGSGSGRKVRGGGGMVTSGQQPPRCQVEGCEVDLSDAKAYYSRHKVCGMHSKSPVVTVAGLEQRFCQQCSRFHQLPEFDQGKRSCRRRLAGHNERRRKPTSGPFLGTRYGRLSSTVIENSSRGGGFLVNFSAYQMVGGRDGWPVTRVSEQVSGNQTTVTARHLPQPLWQNHSQDPPPDRYLQCSTAGTGFSGTGIPCGECFTGVADSNCALSLLSNQPWGSKNQTSGLGVGDLMHAHTKSVGVGDLMHAHTKSVAQPVSPCGAAINQYPNMSWGFKGNEAGSSSHQMAPQLGLAPTSVPINSQFSGELELSQQSRRYMKLEHSRDYDESNQQMHWSL